jgi:tryptophan synthase alpha chain
MDLESYIRERLNQKDILLMTHIVLGYPSFEDSFRIIETMVEAGVDLMELQIPFSEPIADGPVILKASQNALKAGARVRTCLDLAGEITRTFNIPFLFMSYYNIFFRYGLSSFVATMAERGIKGAIIPDLPPEEGQDYLKLMNEHALSPIQLFAPTTRPERMNYLNSFAKGFIYCVARKGVTGQETQFSEDLSAYLSRCREATSLPLALGFGIKERADVDYLKGKAEIAIIGTQTIRIIEKEGIKAVGSFVKGLR